MRTHLVLMATLFLGAISTNAAIWTVEWDAPPPGHGTLEYVVQEKQGDDTWVDKATTSGLSMAFTVTPAAGTEYRLLIRNVNTGQVSIDPNIVIPVPADLPPPASLNFRLKTTAAATIDIGKWLVDWRPTPIGFGHTFATVAPPYPDKDGRGPVLM